jgi:hypothetical protein
MKRKLVTGAAAALLLVLAACEDNPVANFKSVKFVPSKSTANKEQLYNTNGGEYTGNGNVLIDIEKSGGGVERKEIGTVTGGKITFTLPDITGETYEWYNYQDELPKDVTASPAKAKYLGFSVCFIEDGSGLEYSLFKSGPEWDNSGTKNNDRMTYVNVDQNVSINGTFSDTHESYDDSSSIVIIQSWSKVSLKKGWNELYEQTTSIYNEAVKSTTTQSITSTSPKNGLNWVIDLKSPLTAN